MSDREAEYRKETGKDIRPLDHLTRDWTMITAEYYRWLIQKLDKAESDRDELIELAAMCVDTMDEEEYPTTIKHVNDAINRIREVEK